MNEQPTSTSNVKYFASATERLARLQTHLPALNESFRSFHRMLQELSRPNLSSSQEKPSESSTL